MTLADIIQTYTRKAGAMSKSYTQRTYKKETALIKRLGGELLHIKSTNPGAWLMFSFEGRRYGITRSTSGKLVVQERSTKVDKKTLPKSVVGERGTQPYEEDVIKAALKWVKKVGSQSTTDSKGQERLPSKWKWNEHANGAVAQMPGPGSFAFVWRKNSEALLYGFVFGRKLSNILPIAENIPTLEAAKARADEYARAEFDDEHRP